MSVPQRAATAQDCRKEDTMNQKRITALYERLSVDDEREGESNSIATQKRILEDYANRNGFKPFKHWSDDGVSGATFEREGWNAMIAEVETGNIGTILIKDMSRFGRDYLRVGLYMEMFREKGVRLIAVNDGVDTLKDDDDFTPFRNIINEWFVRDTSRKIKAAYRSRGMAGKHTASSAPYGYLKNKEDKNLWEVDPDAAAIVRRIFQMTLDGHGPYQICCMLKAEKIPMPGYYLAQKGAGLHQSHVFPDPYNWTSSSVCNILKKREYLGHTVNFKSKKNSYKEKKNRYVPEDEWVIFPNTHEPIIDQETFDNVQRIRGNIKRRPDGWGYVHPLSGLMYCSDCGGKLYVHRITNGKDRPMYVCGNYSKYISGLNGKVTSGMQCESAHRIDAATVVELVRDTLKAIAEYAKTDKAAFEKAVKESLSAQQSIEVKNQAARLSVCKKSVADLEILIRKIYEDNALGKLPDKRYQSLSAEYENEQASLEKEMGELQSAISVFESGGERAARFIGLVKRYQDFEDMSVAMLNEFIEKIVVYERDRKGCKDANQRVDIYLNFIGAFSVPKEEIDPAVLAAQEEEQRIKRERQERLHQNYLKRKESGKQQEYERRYNERRRALRAADKAALFAEGATLGANALAPLSLPVSSV